MTIRLTIRSTFAAVAGLALLSGCAADTGRPKGPGAFVAGLGGGLVNVHDGMVRTLLGEKAGRPMLIAPAIDESVDERRAQRAAATLPRDEQPDESPTTMSAADVMSAESADLDADGRVSLDELVTIGRSGLSDDDVIERLERTGQVFNLTERQEAHLRTRGVSEDVIHALRTVNRTPRPRTDVVSAPAPGTPRAYDSVGLPDAAGARVDGFGRGEADSPN